MSVRKCTSKLLGMINGLSIILTGLPLKLQHSHLQTNPQIQFGIIMVQEIYNSPHKSYPTDVIYALKFNVTATIFWNSTNSNPQMYPHPNWFDICLSSSSEHMVRIRFSTGGYLNYVVFLYQTCSVLAKKTTSVHLYKHTYSRLLQLTFSPTC